MYMGCEEWVHGAHARCIFVLRECIWIAPSVSLVLLAFENIGSLGSLPRQMDYTCFNGSTLGE